MKSIFATIKCRLWITCQRASKCFQKVSRKLEKAVRSFHDHHRAGNCWSPQIMKTFFTSSASIAEHNRPCTSKHHFDIEVLSCNIHCRCIYYYSVVNNLQQANVAIVYFLHSYICQGKGEEWSISWCRQRELESSSIRLEKTVLHTIIKILHDNNGIRLFDKRWKHKYFPKFLTLRRTVLRPLSRSVSGQSAFAYMSDLPLFANEAQHTATKITVNLSLCKLNYGSSSKLLGFV